MVDRDVALEALSTILNASVTSVQKQSRESSRSRGGSSSVGLSCAVFGFPFSKPCPFGLVLGGAAQPLLSVKSLIGTVLDADETSQVSESSFRHIQSVLLGGPQAPTLLCANAQDVPTGKTHIIDENEFFAPEFDYDFTNLKDTKTYYRGGEEYQRPCGWFRLALKVHDKYDGNTWLGNRHRSTRSVPGEWPVSFHGTSKQEANGIIGGFYKAGPRERYGRGVYSTPDMAVAEQYAKSFTHSRTRKKYKVILQNRVNPKFRKKHNNDKYWLVPIPKTMSNEEEQEMVEKAIRPYGLLLKEVS